MTDRPKWAEGGEDDDERSGRIDIDRVGSDSHRHETDGANKRSAGEVRDITSDQRSHPIHPANTSQRETY